MTFAYEVNNIPGMDLRFIYATGMFVEGTAAKFSLFLKENNIVEQDKIKGPATVVFESPGGSVFEALEMGRTIRQMGLNTEVDTGCYSACTLAFLVGVRRSVGMRAEFGVHRVSVPGLNPALGLDMGQILVAQIEEYAAFMGVDPGFVTALTKAGPGGINLLSHDQLLNYKIISMPFTTQWEIKALAGKFYLLGTTEANNAEHKMMFICNGRGGMDIQFLYNVGGENKDLVLKTTRVYRLVIDGKEYDINDAVLQRIATSSGKPQGQTPS